MGYHYRGLAPLSYGLEQDDGSRAVYTHDDEGSIQCIGRLMPALDPTTMSFAEPYYTRQLRRRGLVPADGEGGS